MNPMCQYFELDQTFEVGGVSSNGHDAEADLTFFWPLPNGGALRVHVCQKHCDLLKELHTALIDGSKCE